MRLSRLNIALYIGLIFLSGAVVGVFADRLYSVSGVRAKDPRDPKEWRSRYMAEMKSRLGLRPDQVTSLNNILDETRTRFHEVHDRMQPELDAIREQQVNKIRAMLDDRQRAEYEKMRAERLQHQPKNGPHPPPGL
ncbi:MAG TPA: hypothetical protein VFA28_21185 [Bryobacteraceae bacterium]|jgi:hypothetical protein|nr:hypothetical protein [Bryobacteraceae bacterium]